MWLFENNPVVGVSKWYLTKVNFRVIWVWELEIAWVVEAGKRCEAEFLE
jgi:hypothetical protein